LTLLNWSSELQKLSIVGNADRVLMTVLPYASAVFHCFVSALGMLTVSAFSAEVFECCPC